MWRWVGYCVTRTGTASAMVLSLAGSCSRANWSRRLSISLSHGQPNMALSHPALKKPAITGFRMSAATQEVRNACQPPWAGGSFFARRATSVCQSIETMSTLNPPFSRRFLATGARFVRTTRSVDCMSTMGVPSYPASLRRALDFSKFDSSSPSIPFVDSSGVPHTNIALHTLYDAGSPMVALRKSSWLKAYHTAWRIFGLSKGLCSVLNRNTYWLPRGFRFRSLTLGSALRTGARSWGGDSIMSTSPARRALTAVWCSGITRHSTRSTLTTLPPANPDGGSGRGLYWANFTYTALSPGFHSSF